jgi:hypothetical protein
MMKVMLSLPSNYSVFTLLEPLKKLKFVIGAVVMGIVLLVIIGWLFTIFTNALRPTALDGMRLPDLLSSTSAGSSFVIHPDLFQNLGLALIAVLFLHEFVHGLFYWLFSRHRPKFGFQGLFPYAAAPCGIYFPRNEFIVVGLSPLVLLTAVGLLLILIVPITFIPFLLFFVAFNAAGAAGDLIMVLQLVPISADAVIEDKGSSVVVYGLNGNR